MSILDIKARFSQRILKAEEDIKESKTLQNGARSMSVNVTPTDIQENDVGIVEYVSDLPGFHAVIKQRYSDFSVHEIDLNDRITVLNSFEVPDEDCPVTHEGSTFLSESDLSNLEKLVGGDDSLNPLLIDVTERSKDERKDIHQFIKGKYGSKVISGTTDEADRKMISVSRTTKEINDSMRRPAHLPKYVHFILWKSNMETMEALNILGKKLRLKARHFGICGTKDKRGNTTQWVSVKQILASKLNQLNKSLRRLMIGNYVYKDFPLALGSLNGNNFQIALRNINVSDESIEEAVTKLKDRGFINYFGLQRFGKYAASPTHEIGRQIIKEAYANAVDLILKPRGDNEFPDMKQAREIWTRTRDPGQALNALRTKDRTIEGKLLHGLVKSGPTAYVNALDCLPRNVRLLYMHAYQSLVWNKVASKRISKYGLSVLQGDLVYVDPKSETAVVSNGEEDPEAEDAEEDETEVVEKKIPLVKILTAEDVSSYDVFDIVIPLPGIETTYPKNEVADWYKEVLAEDGLTIDSFGSRSRKYSLQGSYRKLLQRPKNLTWKIMRYTKPDDDLILNDVELLEGKVLTAYPEGQFKALVLNFDLTPSSYATMALREILRSDTSASHQTKLQNALLKRAGDTIENGEPKKRREDDLQQDELTDENTV